MNWEILIAVIGALGGIEALRYLLNWRANKRSELARATGNELQTLKETCQFLQQQLLEKEQRFEDQTKRLREKQDALFKEREARFEAELELSVKRCNDIHCPFRQPPTAHTHPCEGLTKEKYHKTKQEA